MYIEKIRLKNFRNYADEAFEFGEKINIIAGKNAQGKTNLVEGISLLSMAKSFRTTKETEMIAHGEDRFLVSGEFSKHGNPYILDIEFFEQGKSIQKKYQINGVKKEKVTDLFSGIYTVVFSPEDLKIVQGEPDRRRRFLDRELILIKPSYYENLRKYKKILKNRNLLLKEAKDGVKDENLLRVYDEYLAEAGALVMEQRADFIVKLSKTAKETARKISAGADELEVEYNPSAPREAGKERQEKKLLEILAEQREKDILYGTTGVGPHRDDLLLKTNGRELKSYGSQGQQRTASLALRLAEQKLIKEETGEDAILLLDDVLSELDRDRQKLLLENFEDNQLFITTADMNEKIMGDIAEKKLIIISAGEATK
ncbi:MAG: DNA replication/repair protein RecF [Clostridiales Family XIII bacterium]|jgi:DNA replication and repair protein RecF|nr:DNA replication/repair protein RecF [Clostridiales Family XIII bacterium]